MTQYAYLFEARGIQRFLFASGRLRDMLGGSELLDYVTAKDGLLEQTLNQLSFKPRAVRQAGGAFYLVFNRLEEAQRLRAVWRLACATWLPGLECVDALCEGTSAYQAIKVGIEQLHKARNELSVEVPRASPITERSQRTGLAVTEYWKKEYLDATTYRQASFKRPSKDSLIERFLPESDYHWPDNFEDDSHDSKRFPLNERRLVGLIHADGNGLGELLRILSRACENADDNTYITLYRTFSEGLNDATQKAAQQATKTVLLPAVEKKVLPARPLVLGGDDLTILVRADLALPFTKEFLKAFEQYSRESMDKLRKVFNEAKLEKDADKLPTHLTAAAGICYMKCNQPFYAAYELAESLCKRAKNKVRDKKPTMPATLALHKVQDSLLSDADTQFQHNHCVSLLDDKSKTELNLELALRVYALDAKQGLPVIADLEEILDIFKGSLNDRPLRELATLMHSNLALARSAYKRWRDLAYKHQPDALQRFDQCLGRLLQSQVMSDLPCGNATETVNSPLADILVLLTVQPKN